MGNACKGKSAVKSYKYDFSEEEITKLRASFQGLSDSSKKYLSENSLQENFQENPELGKHIYKWMHSNSGSLHVNFDSFLSSSFKNIQIYILSGSHTPNASSLQSFKLANGTHHLGKRQIVSHEEIHKFFGSLAKIFYQASSDHVSKVADIAISGLFGEIKEELSWASFCSGIKKSFPHLSLIVKHYLNGKLFDKALLPKPIVMNHESSIIKPEHLSLLLLSNNKIFSNEFDLLYTSLKDGSSFNRLSHAISGYDGPTFILFQHVDNGDSSSAIKKGDKFIFGVYSFETWNDHLSYSGDSQEYLFALTPKFRALHTKKGTSKGQNYRYLYSKKSQIHKHKIGLGIGGDQNFENFRLWIGDDIEADCYTHPEDATFETGYLVDPSIRKLNIQTIEVWGFGGKEALKAQEDFRNDNLKTIESVRKLRKGSSSSLVGIEKHALYKKTESEDILSNKI